MKPSGQWVVAAQYIELHAAGNAGLYDGRLAVRLLGLRCFIGQPRSQEPLAALQIAHQIDGQVALPADAQADIDAALRGDSGFDAGDLNARRKHAFEVHHHRGPTEALAGKEIVEEGRAFEHGRFCGSLHARLVSLALDLCGESLRFEGVHLRLVDTRSGIQNVQSGAECNRRQRQSGHCEAKPREQGPQFDKGARREIDCNAHQLASAPRTPASQPNGTPPGEPAEAAPAPSIWERSISFTANGPTCACIEQRDEQPWPPAFRPRGLPPAASPACPRSRLRRR